MTREKFPEKIPFRLTRMLINAMEVTGIEGTYRSTCESVMTVLRNNKDSLMAVLEAFVYDPLLNWRLIETGNKSKKAKEKAATTAPSTSSSTAPGGAGAEAAAEASSANLLDVNPLTGGDQMVPPAEPSVSNTGHESATLVISFSITLWLYLKILTKFLIMSLQAEVDFETFAVAFLLLENSDKFLPILFVLLNRRIEMNFQGAKKHLPRVF